MREAYSAGSEWAMVDRVERLTTLRYALSEALTLRGQAQMSEPQQERVCDSLDRYITDNFPKLRTRELDLVVQMGIGGELSRDTYVTGAAVMQWVRTYYQTPARTKIVDDEYEAAHEGQPGDSGRVSRNLEAYRTRFRDAYEYWQEHWTIFDSDRHKDRRAFSPYCAHWAAMVYKFYLDAGKIDPPTPEELNAAAERASRTVLERQNEQTGSMPQLQEPLTALQDDMEDLRMAYLLETHYAKTSELMQ